MTHWQESKHKPANMHMLSHANVRHRVAFLLLFVASLEIVVATTNNNSTMSSATLQQIETNTTVANALNAADQVLQRHEQLQQEIFTAKELGSTLSSLSLSVESLQQKVQQIANLQEASNNLLQTVNRQQIETLIERLDVVSLQEQERRVAETSEGETLDTVPKSLPSNWQNQLDPAIILAESESTLEAWITKLMHQELNRNYISTTISNSGNEKSDCTSLSMALIQVQSALDEYATRLENNILQGATIVHELTSTTYQPPFQPTASYKLSWWYRYLPQDWENALEWLKTKHSIDILSWLHIPNHIYHTFRKRGANTAPPESVLQDSLLPGSCWPVSVSNEPTQITFRFAPLYVGTKLTAVTIEHVSRLLVQERSSAPKHIKIYTYTSDILHNGPGLNMTSKRLVHEVTYQLKDDSRNSQTFQIPTLATSDERASNADESICSDVTMTCGDMDQRVAGMTIEIVENWGHPNYTCLYGVRAHGDL